MGTDESGPAVREAWRQFLDAALDLVAALRFGRVAATVRRSLNSVEEPTPGPPTAWPAESGPPDSWLQHVMAHRPVWFEGAAPDSSSSPDLVTDFGAPEFGSARRDVHLPVTPISLPTASPPVTRPADDLRLMSPPPRPRRAASSGLQSPLAQTPRLQAPVEELPRLQHRPTESPRPTRAPARQWAARLIDAPASARGQSDGDLPMSPGRSGRPLTTRTASVPLAVVLTENSRPDQRRAAPGASVQPNHLQSLFQPSSQTEPTEPEADLWPELPKPALGGPGLPVPLVPQLWRNLAEERTDFLIRHQRRR